MSRLSPKNSVPSPKSTNRPCPFPDELQPHIRSSYKKLALVVSEKDLEHVEIDSNTLIVSCDWLLWHKLSAEKKHIVYYELGILRHKIPDRLNTDLYNDTNSWINECDPDPTLFHGVSLGRLFGGELAMANMNYHRINMAIRGLVDLFSPEELIFVDFRYDINHLNFNLRRQLVASISADLKLKFIDSSYEDTDATPDNVTVYRLRSTSLLKEKLASCYAASMNVLTHIRCLLSKRSIKILILVNANIAEPLVKEYLGNKIVPTFIARTIPKKAGIIFHCLRHGILLTQTFKREPDSADSKRLSEIFIALKSLCHKSDNAARDFILSYIETNILNHSSLQEAAMEVLAAEGIYDKIKPSRVVVDGVRSRRSLAYIELAKSKNIAVDYIWHAPQTPQSLKMGALGGDPTQPVFVDRCLSWGETNELWLKRVHAHQPVVRVGSPLHNRYANSSGKRISSIKSPSDINILFLQYGFNVSDLAGVNANLYGTFVDCVRLLNENGYHDIKLKMHPGPGRWTKPQFERIRDFFDLDCDILMLEPFEECLAWADQVIGPSHTGAMFETLAANKPYHALLLQPHSTFDKSYFGDFPIIEDIKDIPVALKRDNTLAERKVLENLYSNNEIPNSSKRFWQVMNNANFDSVPPTSLKESRS